jgi:hypothetical protein
MMPTTPPVAAIVRSCSSSMLRQCGVMPVTPVWLTSSGKLGSCVAAASKKPVRLTWARSTKIRAASSCRT